MAITPKLEIKQSQSLLMTPQLRQAINLLQMSNLELEELIDNEIVSNPFLEKENDSPIDEEKFPQSIDDYDSKSESTSQITEEEFSTDFNIDEHFDDSTTDSEGYNNLDNSYTWDEINHRKNNLDSENYDYFEKKLSEKPSLYQILEQQINLNFKQRYEQLLARYLCEYLDSAGYFRGNIKELSLQLKISEQKLNNILHILKQFEPSGIFAQDLAECLKLQLEAEKETNSTAYRLLDYLPQIAEKKFKEIKKLCQIDDEELQRGIQKIKSLNPKPTADYYAQENRVIIPDVIVKRNRYGQYQVELNEASLPRVLINRHYYAEIKQTIKDKESKHFLTEKINSANFLTKALHQRATTILKVCEEIIKYQYDFFEKGIEYLKPMLLKDIAENIEMHESTVSRISNGKYMHTPLGLFELKYFFSQAAGSYSGNEQTSVLSIKHKIKKLIDEEETSHILSDDEISEILARSSIKVARRTVAKYRESLGLGSSAQRKREKRNQR